MPKKRIMVVEDEGITALRIQKNLEDMGYTVTSMEFTGEDAVKKAEHDVPDLVLMDIVLDGTMDGIEAAGQLRSRFNIPVVYITAHSDEKILNRIKKTEPFGYIIKPFDERELRTAVEIALYKHEIDRKLREQEKELRKHREQLAELVEERTAELRSSAELLKEEISDRRLAEAEAIRSSHLAALGELAAGVAHEINNPINGIINYAQILLNKNGHDADEKDIAHRIIKESDRIANIVRSLLSFAHDRKEIKHNSSIPEIMSDTLTLTRTQLKKDGIDLKVDIPSDICNIAAQPQQLEQVFLNIISNARYALNQKFAGPNKKKILEIQCKKIADAERPYIQISFYDTGTGIPADILNKIMNPFFTTKPSSAGTGLGLSISQNIINNHGGKIIIDSKEGEYTRITVNLPLNTQ